MPVKKILIAGLAATITAASLVSTADAHRRNHGDAFAAGVFGLAAGALLSGAFYGPRYGHYYDDDYPSAYYYDEPGYYYRPAPRVYYREAPVYYRQAPRYYDGYGYDPCDAPTGVSKPANAMC